MNPSHRPHPAARAATRRLARIEGRPALARAAGRALLIAAMLSGAVLPGAIRAQADPPWSPPAADQAPAPPADSLPDSPAEGPADGPVDRVAPETDPLEDFMGRLLDRARPTLEQLGRDLGATAQALAPVLEDLARLMDDARNYHRPERLENGDILIRRRAGAPPPPPVGPALRDLLGPDAGGTVPPSGGGTEGGPDAMPPAPPSPQDPDGDMNRDTDQPGTGEIEL